MARYKMLRNAHGSPDGIKVQHFEKGEVYDLTDSLAAVFTKHKYAEPVEEAPKAKAKGAAPENKAKEEQPEE